MPSITAMIDQLFGSGEKYKAINESIGKFIQTIDLKDNALIMSFTDGTAIRIWDDGQDCCERRYMTCDDPLHSFCNVQFLGAEIRDGGTRPDGEVHEVQFLIIKTGMGCFTCETHNEHNGYYGGFIIRSEYTTQPNISVHP